MDYPQLNLIFGLILVFTVVAGISLRILLSKVHLPAWMSILSWLTLVTSLLSASYIETLFLRRMTPAFNQQIILGFLIIGGIGALVTTSLYKRMTSSNIASILAVAQILVGWISIGVAFGLYRSLVPISPP